MLDREKIVPQVYAVGFCVLDTKPMAIRQKSDAQPLGRPRKGPLKPTQIVSSVSEPARIIFLDIETTGLSRYYDELTLVGYAIDGMYHVHIAGDDPEHLRNALAQAATLVTFNGTLFDIPFLKKTFGEISLPGTHIDLRYVGRRVGLAGGQKQIERELGIVLREGIEDIGGREAVLLWHQYLRGDKPALRKLIAYNEADVRGMHAILDHVLGRLELPADLFFELPRFSNGLRGVGRAAELAAELPDAARLGRRFTSFTSLFERTPGAGARVVGIDLTGSEKRASGFCVLRGGFCETSLLATDEEIVSATLSAQPAIVSIDSPLSLPRGRMHVRDDDPGRDRFGIMRICERTLKKRGVNVYPCLLPSMQRLTQRGMELATRFRKIGIPVIESYPGAAQDIMGIPRKGAGEELLQQGLANFGLTGAFVSEKVKHDELDAITSAVVGCFFLAGKYEALRGPEEGALIIPDLNAELGACVIGLSGRIGSGKTTAARFIEKQGYSYTRFSEVIDDVIASSGVVANRDT
ncbi:MAG TPA: ribonuclease H-like domain-containing protein, partial [Rhizomicrobium sp.]|nr:ribonuclease H-like domain-containing protein [Rhizomicrobium sp.]